MSLYCGGHLVNREGGVGCIPTCLPGAKYESEYILSFCGSNLMAVDVMLCYVHVAYVHMAIQHFW
jgi:hypothetical protein